MNPELQAAFDAAVKADQEFKAAGETQRRDQGFCERRGGHGAETGRVRRLNFRPFAFLSVLEIQSKFSP